jgi:hypothetical protein
MSMEVITTTDKARRDRMYKDLRENGDELERKVVKFSSVEPNPLKQGQWISNWSIAWPKETEKS